MQDSATTNDQWASETVELLQSEIELLRAELADRDQQLSEFERAAFESGSAAAESSSDDQAIFENRIEDLLAEFHRSESRLRSLEDLLLLSEDAAQAEQEERKQIERWLEDLERRMTGRENEWQAEVDSLKQQLEHKDDEIEQSRNRIKESTTNSCFAGYEKTIGSLEEERATLQRDLREARQTNVELSNKIKEMDVESMLERQAQCIEEAQREQHLIMAKERAEFFRQKSDLVRQIDELQHGLGEPTPRHNADERFNAFREHLREIHEQEKNVEPPRPPLTARLKQLWQRLDGPTDRE